MLRVQRCYDPEVPDVTFRILQASCPSCHKHVQFAMMDDEFLGKEVEYLEGRIKSLLEQLHNQELIIRRFTRGESK